MLSKFIKRKDGSQRPELNIEEDIKIKKMSIFDHLSNLTEKKIEYDEHNERQTKSYIPYMINRYMSTCELFTQLINEVNTIKLPKKQHYNFLLRALPKRKQYFTYIKKRRDVDQETKALICRYYRIGPRQIDEYIDILTDEQINEIINVYDYGIK